MKLLKYTLVIVGYEILSTALNFVTTRSLTVSGVVGPETDLTLFARPYSHDHCVFP